MKSRKFEVEFFSTNDDEAALKQTQEVTAETDTAAVMMAMYNIRNASDSLQIKSVTEVKGK